MIFLFSYFFFFKQTTAYELRISDWSSDVCSSDLGIMASRGYNGGGAGAALGATEATNYQYDPEYVWNYELYGRQELADGRLRLTANVFYADYKDYQQIGRASGRESGGQPGEVQVGAATIKKKAQRHIKRTT